MIKPINQEFSTLREGTTPRREWEKISNFISNFTVYGFLYTVCLMDILQALLLGKMVSYLTADTV